MDLAGKLIIKVSLGEDIRRIPIHNEDITYDELILMMQRIFKGKLAPSDELIVKYKDEDDDLVTVFDDSDLAFAIQCSKILKITLTIKDGRIENSNHSQMVSGDDRGVIRRELQGLRDKINRLLDCLEDSQPAATSSSAGGTPVAASDVTASHRADSMKSKEFDPLSGQPKFKQPSPPQPPPPATAAAPSSLDDSTQNKVMSSFGLATSSTSGTPARTGTPDSQISLGSGKAANDAASNGTGRGGPYQPPPQPPAMGGYPSSVGGPPMESYHHHGRGPQQQYQHPHQQRTQQSYQAPPPPSSSSTDHHQQQQQQQQPSHHTAQPPPPPPQPGQQSSQPHSMPMYNPGSYPSTQTPMTTGFAAPNPNYAGGSPAHNSYYVPMPHAQQQRSGQDQPGTGASYPGPDPHSTGSAYAPPPPAAAMHYQPPPPPMSTAGGAPPGPYTGVPPPPPPQSAGQRPFYPGYPKVGYQ